MDRKIRVLQFSQLINRYDFMDVLVRYADTTKFDMHACTFTIESNIERPEYEKTGYPHFVLGVPFNKRGFLRAVFKLSAYLRKEQIDVVHAHHYYEAFVARLALWFAPKCKLVITRHYHNELFLTTKGLKLRLYLFIERIVARKASVVISPSSQITQLLITSGVNRSKIREIPYGFDFNAEKYQPRSDEDNTQWKGSLGIDRKHLVIGNFGRQHSIKGQDLMLKAFAIIARSRTDIRLIMVGDGPFHTTLVKLTEDLGLDDLVIFTGWQKQVRPILSAVDIVWHPTRQEAFPQIMIESMAMGKPLFITPVSGATDVVVDTVNGYLLPFNRPDEWASKLLSVIEDRDKLRNVGAQARKTVAKFDIRSIIMEIESVYIEVA